MKFCWNRQAHVLDAYIKNTIGGVIGSGDGLHGLNLLANEIKKMYYVKENAEDEKFYFRCFIFLFDVTTHITYMYDCLYL